jgi:Ca2+/Na+ antiporter
MSLFPEANVMDFPSLIFMMIVYGYILMKGSQLIGDGSEMLLLMYGPGIIGGLLIPILGAIPDCAVILVSGLGSGKKEEIQQELSVGVGTLVGSTVMLLTLPWAIGIFLGRRDIDPKTGSVVLTQPKKPKVTHFSLRTNGVTVLDEISGTAKVMMIASLTYLIIQIPAFFYKSNPDAGAKAEAPFALIGLIVAFVVFALYCFFQYSSAQQGELTRLQQESLRKEQWKKSLDSRLSKSEYQELIFRKHDKDNSGFIEAVELKSALAELGLNLNRTSIQEILDQIDVGHKDDGDEGKKDGKISLNEFKHAINTWVREGRSKHENENENENLKSDHTKVEALEVNNNTTEIDQKLIPFSHKSEISLKNIDEEKEDAQEEEDEEEEFWELTDTQIKLKACFLLVVGTAVCTIFSDPMVDVISSVGTKMNISPFYISFVITPLASNASEVIAGLMFAKKKTTESITLTLATLHGAATMNSTLALGIFMSLIYFRNLSWSFSAEVITVLFVIFMVGLNSLRKNIRLWQAVFVLSLYPLSILLVYVLENQFGLD